MSSQVQEQEQGKGNDGPPVEEDNDESEGANAEQSVCKEEWGEPGQNDYCLSYLISSFNQEQHLRSR